MTFSTVRTRGHRRRGSLGIWRRGALTGFAGAALGITLIALVAWARATGTGLPICTWFAFLLPIVLFKLTLNGTLLLDVWVLKNTAAQLGIESGMDVAAAAIKPRATSGLYRAGQNFAFVPYQVILSVTFIVFPLVSRATAAGDLAAARVHIRNALRFSLIVLFALAAPLSGAAEAARFAGIWAEVPGGADTLSVLVFGQIALALFVIVATVLTSAGQARHLRLDRLAWRSSSCSAPTVPRAPGRARRHNLGGGRPRHESRPPGRPGARHARMRKLLGRRRARCHPVALAMAAAVAIWAARATAPALPCCAVVMIASGARLLRRCSDGRAQRTERARYAVGFATMQEVRAIAALAARTSLSVRGPLLHFARAESRRSCRRSSRAAQSSR